MNLKEIKTHEWVFYGILLVLIIFVIKGLLENNPPNKILKGDTTSYLNADTTTPHQPIVAPIEEKPNNWTYDTTKDEMTSGSTIIASTDATNSFEFNAPYDGYNGATIQIRRKRGRTDAIFTIQKGQFVGGVEGQTIKARFDQKRYSEYYCNPASDYDPTVLFIDDAGTFVEHLKDAKKLLIEANIYDNGNQQFEFSVDGFKWGSSKKRKPKFDYGFTVALPKDGKQPPQKKGYISVTGRNRNGHDTVIYIKGYQITPNQ